MGGGPCAAWMLVDSRVWTMYSVGCSLACYASVVWTLKRKGYYTIQVNFAWFGLVEDVLLAWGWFRCLGLSGSHGARQSTFS